MECCLYEEEGRNVIQINPIPFRIHLLCIIHKQRKRWISRQNPAAIKAFLSAFSKGIKEVMANPDAAIDYVKARDGIINVDLEKRRLRMAIDAVVASPDARTEGFGVAVPARLALMASQVSDAFGTKTRVDPQAVWTDGYLPPKAALDVLPPLKK